MSGYDLNSIVLGDAYYLAETLQPESVDIIFTDPVYDMYLAYSFLGETAKRVLKPDGCVLVWSSGHWHKAHVTWLENAGLTYRWDFACMINSGLSPMDGKIITKTNRLIWMDIEHRSKLTGYLPDGFIDRPWLKSGTDEEHKWTKSPRFTRLALKAFYTPGCLVYDPFAGGGTIPCMCKELGINFIAGEINPETFARACTRLLSTNVPLGIDETIRQLGFEDKE